MTKLLYQLDSYIKQFDAQCIGVDEENHAIILDQTAFYPGGGGQPSDTGQVVINEKDFKVSKVKKINGQILHFLTEWPPHIIPGNQLTGHIDWEKRYQTMRTHTAMHVLCGVIFRDYGASVTGGDMEPLKGRMDFEFESMHRELVDEIQAAVTLEIEKALPVKVAILPRAEAFLIPDLIRTKINLLPEGIAEVRVVEIEGLDLQADGGTHVNNTGEVGAMRIVDYKSKGKINKRIYVEVGNKAS